MQTKTKSDWKILVQGFVGDILERLSDNVSKKLEAFMAKLKKRAIGAILILIGFIFFLDGFAVFLNFLFGNQFPWLGWSVVGLVVFWIGYKLFK
jgi:hypothetical protein